MGKWGGPSGGCGLPPQYWGGDEHQRPGQTENVTVRSLHFISYSRKFLQGRKFRDFPDQTPACEICSHKAFSSKNFLLTSQAQAADPVNQQKNDLFCCRIIKQTAKNFHDLRSTCLSSLQL